ncbi:MAG TPA: isopenicillin N synthase family oxygenase, partial [Pseudomonas sp.]|nr:isopenicillin N synthase family oxygenase [Pseudomonas sp.]
MNESLCARHLEAAALPLIDIAGLFSPDLAERTAVAERIGAACREIGFFCVANHGVDPALQQAVFELARAFFSQPEAGKRALDKAFSNA